VNGRLAAWLVLIGVQVLANYAARASGGKPPKNAIYHWDLAIGGLVQYAIILAVVLAIASPAPRAMLALRRPRAWGRALGFALLVLVAVEVLGAVLNPFLHPGREQGLTPTGFDSHRIAPFVVNFVVVALVAPVVEELTFRGAGFSLLERWGNSFAILAVGVLFGLAHGLVEALPILVVFGAGLAWLRSRTRSVYPGILLHAGFNALALAVAVST
jgi:membrane protease YdiL (CAAX protease family)